MHSKTVEHEIETLILRDLYILQDATSLETTVYVVVLFFVVVAIVVSSVYFDFVQ